MRRRDFLLGGAGALTAWTLPASVRAASPARGYDKLLILIELKGANDGLNTVVPFADPAYAQLRPQIAIKREQVLQISETQGLHPALEPLMPMWKAGELAVINGIGYPSPNFSHFRSIEIWDTASKSEEYLNNGWLGRAFGKFAPPERFAADAIVVGAPDLGPFAGGGRAITLQTVDAYLRQAKLADPHGRAHNAALQHVLNLERDIAQSAKEIAPQVSLKSEFPNSTFGNAVKTAMHVVAGSSGVAAIRLTLGGFDTHINQLATQQGLLKQIADGVAALRAALIETNRWQHTLGMTYAEFGRRAKENLSQGTDHGTANVQLAFGGAVKGGIYGEMPSLTALSGDGNVTHTVDFRDYYATALSHWGLTPADASQILGGRYRALDFLKT